MEGLMYDCDNWGKKNCHEKVRNLVEEQKKLVKNYPY